VTTPGAPPPEGSLVKGGRYSQDVPKTEDGVMALVKGQTTIPWQRTQNKFRVNGRALEEDLRLVNKHEGEIGELIDAYKQLILQGEAQVFTKSGMYRKSEGCVSIEVIMISGGGGGGAGKWDIRGGNWQGGGHGGGGGGELYAKIPAMLLPDEMLVEVHWDGLGAGGVGSEASGTGGGTVKFGNVLTAVGGVGGLGANGQLRPAATGGTGLIVGGTGGLGWVVNADNTESPNGRGTVGGNSTYAGELRGGGGGGGGGSPFIGYSWRGGTGAAFPGGEPGFDGSSPAQIIATGGGGGGGGTDARRNGGNGGWPGGGGGGGCGGTLASNNGNGGNGASGVVYIIERMT